MYQLFYLHETGETVGTFHLLPWECISCQNSSLWYVMTSCSWRFSGLVLVTLLAQQATDKVVMISLVVSHSDNNWLTVWKKKAKQKYGSLFQLSLVFCLTRLQLRHTYCNYSAVGIISFNWLHLIPTMENYPLLLSVNYNGARSKFWIFYDSQL